MPPSRSAEAPTEKLKVFGTTVDPYERYQPDYVQSSASRRADPLIPATELDRIRLEPADAVVNCEQCGRILVR